MIVLWIVLMILFGACGAILLEVSTTSETYPANMLTGIVGIFAIAAAICFLIAACSI